MVEIGKLLTEGKGKRVYETNDPDTAVVYFKDEALAFHGLKRGRIIGKGHNMTERLNDPTAHAEMIAITAATEAMGGKYLNDCTLYVTVEPCPMCAGALAWSQIGKVVYGASDPKRGFSGFSPSLMHPKTEVVSGVLAEECGALVSDFFKKKRS